MTKQEMFDRAWKGLESQGWATSYGVLSNGVPACRYATRDENGVVQARCAWGWVDPVNTDRAAEFAYEGLSVTDLARKEFGLAAKLGIDALEFAQELQEVHDGCQWDGTSLRDGMVALARRFGLTVPVLG
jgi:hypothetical protein